MAFAMPFAPRAHPPRARALLVRLLPALLLLSGALLLSKPWREAAAPETPGAAPALAASVPAALDPAAVAGALLVVGSLLFFLPAFVRRFAPGARGRGGIEVVESRPLGGRRALLLVEIEGRRLLIGASEGGLSTLAEFERGTSRFERALGSELGASPGPAAPATRLTG